MTKPDRHDLASWLMAALALFAVLRLGLLAALLAGLLVYELVHMLAAGHAHVGVTRRTGKAVAVAILSAIIVTALTFGVIGIVYESRPNVTADAAALCIKAGNAVILRGGSESFESNRAIHERLVAGCVAAGIAADAVQMVPTRDRAAVGHLLSSLAGTVDVVVAAHGPGTEWLTGLRAHDEVDIVGPLGRPFPLPKEPVPTILVGGGYGSAPLFWLAETLRERGCRVEMVLGAATESRLFGVVEARRCADGVTITTDDGSGLSCVTWTSSRPTPCGSSGTELLEPTP